MTPWIAVVLILVAMWAAQESFLEIHRRRYGLWRSARERHFWAEPAERRCMWDAAVHRSPDRSVEVARLVFVGVWAVGAIAALALLGSGALSPGR